MIPSSAWLMKTSPERPRSCMKCEPKEPVQSQHSKLVTELNYGRIQCAAGMNLHRKNSQTGSGEELSQGFLFPPHTFLC